jgi:hypothetical protein
MSIKSCERCGWIHYATELCGPELIIIDDPVPDSERELTPEVRERMAEWYRSVLPDRRG